MDPNWKIQPKLSSDGGVNGSPQVPEQVVAGLINALADGPKSVSEMMKALGLKHRPNFIEYTLTPAMQQGYVTMQYPNSPHHPRQKYLLTDKGKGLKICSS